MPAKRKQSKAERMQDARFMGYANSVANVMVWHGMAESDRQDQQRGLAQSYQQNLNGMERANDRVSWSVDANTTHPALRHERIQYAAARGDQLAANNALLFQRYQELDEEQLHADYVVLPNKINGPVVEMAKVYSNNLSMKK